MYMMVINVLLLLQINNVAHPFERQGAGRILGTETFLFTNFLLLLKNTAT
jgi:hypothetical protein